MDDELFDIVADELNANRIVLPLWEAALKNNDNDPVAAEEEYIGMRIVQLQKKQSPPAITLEREPLRIRPQVSPENTYPNEYDDNFPAMDEHYAKESSKRKGNLPGLTIMLLFLLTTLAVTYLIYRYLA